MREWAKENLENQYYDWPLFKRILGYLQPYRLLVAVSLLLLLAVSMLNLVGPYLTKVVIDDFIRVGQYQDWLRDRSDQNTRRRKYCDRELSRS